MSVHALRRLGEAKEEETGLRSVSAGVREWKGRVCAYRLPKQKGKRRGAMLLLLLLLLVRAGITQLFNLKPPDSN